MSSRCTPVFTQLGVLDNLLLAPTTCQQRARRRVEEGFALFPEIAAKRHNARRSCIRWPQQILAVRRAWVRRRDC